MTIKERISSHAFCLSPMEEQPSPQNSVSVHNLVVGIARPTSLAIWHRMHSIKRQTSFSARLAMNFSHETLRGSRHGKCCEICGEFLLFCAPLSRETKLESAQKFSRLILHHFHQTLCSCTRQISWSFSLCGRLSLTNSSKSQITGQNPNHFGGSFWNRNISVVVEV